MSERLGDPPSDREWIKTLETRLQSLQEALEGEAKRLRDEAVACRDEATRRSHVVTAELALGEGAAIDRRADRLQQILADSKREGSAS